MYARLSPETVSFINQGVASTNDLNFREALNRYSEEIICAIKEVCLELSKDGIVDSDWSIEDSDEDEGDEQMQLAIVSKHSNNFFRLSIDREYNCEWSYHFPDYFMLMIESNHFETNSFKRYFQISNTKEGETIIRTRFSKRQLVSRYLVDYLIHLSNQLAPVIKIMSDPTHAVAA